MQSPRRLAIKALGEVLARGAKPRQAVEAVSTGIEARDRAFLMEVLYGVLRRRDRLDWVLDMFLKKPSGLKVRTRDNLRVALYQLFYTRVPDFAVVDEAVGMEKKSPALVNAVLRSVQRERNMVETELRKLKARAVEPGTPERERVSAVAAYASHPAWLVRRWIKRFGPEGALALAEAGNQVPLLTLRVNSLRATRDEVIARLAGMGIEAVPTRLSPDGVQLKDTHAVTELKGLMGTVYVQDEAAQLISRLTGVRPGQRVLDACAAPGGKATHLAELMEDTGEVVALERDGSRIKLLEENVAAHALRSVRIVHGDLMEAAPGLGRFDSVLVDAPCSATGVIRRNPDVRYRLRAEDLEGFRARQAGLMRAAAGLLEPGGVMVFATCSTEPEEGEQAVRMFLKSSGDSFNIEDVPASPEVCDGHFLRTYPHTHGMDGFFGARLKRKL